MMHYFIFNIKLFWKSHRYLGISIITFFCLLAIFLMVKRVVVDFPLKDGKNVVEYYGALSQLYGGIIGGILTVLGVAITIFYTNNDRKQDLLLKEKPQLVIGDNIKANMDNIIKPKLSTINESGKRRVFFEKELHLIGKDNTIFNYDSFNFYVTNNADCLLEGIVLGNNIIYDFDNRYVLKRDNTYTLDLSDYYFIYKGKGYQEIDMVLSSLGEKMYFYSLCGNDKVVDIKGKKTVRIIVDSMFERPKSYEKVYEKIGKNLDDEFWKYFLEKYREKHQKKDD